MAMIKPKSFMGLQQEESEQILSTFGYEDHILVDGFPVPKSDFNPTIFWGNSKSIWSEIQ